MSLDISTWGGIYFIDPQLVRHSSVDVLCCQITSVGMGSDRRKQMDSGESCTSAARFGARTMRRIGKRKRALSSRRIGDGSSIEAWRNGQLVRFAEALRINRRRYGKAKRKHGRQPYHCADGGHSSICGCRGGSTGTERPAKQEERPAFAFEPQSTRSGDHGIQATSRAKWLKEAWNRIMHALNGNGVQTRNKAKANKEKLRRRIRFVFCLILFLYFKIKQLPTQLTHLVSA